MATSPNFSWPEPDNTDLVKNGALAIRTAINAIDTSMVDLKGGTTGQVLSKASATDMDFSWVTDATGIPATIFDAKGDIIAATAADTAGRLAVGTNGQTLVADSSTATGLKWATPTAGGTANWSLLNAGGTALSGSQTVTVSGISGANQVLVIFIAASLANASDTVALRINTDTTTKYSTYGTYVYSPAAYVLGGISQDLGNTGTTYIPLGQMSGSATSFGNGYCLISGANATGIKTFQAVSGFNRGGNDSQSNNIVGGLYTGTSTISSISMYGVASNFDAGTVYVYTTA